MPGTQTVPANVTAEASNCLRAKNLVQVFEWILEYLGRNVPGIEQIEAYVEPNDDPDDVVRVVVLAHRPESFRGTAPAEAAMNEWCRITFPLELHRHFYLGLAHTPG